MNEILAAYPLSHATNLEIAQGDLTQEAVDAIVNAANSSLAHGAGVAAAIASAGGPSIQAESSAWVRAHGLVSNSEPAYTNGGDLPARYVIHAVGPIWGEGEEDRKLAEAVNGSLRRAEMLELETIAFPAISTGIYGFPKARAARVVFETLQRFFAPPAESRLRLVRMVLYDELSAKIFAQIARQVFE